MLLEKGIIAMFQVMNADKAVDIASKSQTNSTSNGKPRGKALNPGAGAFENEDANALQPASPVTVKGVPKLTLQVTLLSQGNVFKC